MLSDMTYAQGISHPRLVSASTQMFTTPIKPLMPSKPLNQMGKSKKFSEPAMDVMSDHLIPLSICNESARAIFYRCIREKQSLQLVKNSAKRRSGN